MRGNLQVHVDGKCADSTRRPESRPARFRDAQRLKTRPMLAQLPGTLETGGAFRYNFVARNSMTKWAAGDVSRASAQKIRAGCNSAVL
jgi:hypothetical protein